MTSFFDSNIEGHKKYPCLLRGVIKSNYSEANKTSGHVAVRISVIISIFNSASKILVRVFQQLGERLTVGTMLATHSSISLAQSSPCHTTSGSN